MLAIITKGIYKTIINITGFGVLHIILITTSTEGRFKARKDV